MVSAEERDAIRERAHESIARANQTLAVPRDPEVIAAAAEVERLWRQSRSSHHAAVIQKVNHEARVPAMGPAVAAHVTAAGFEQRMAAFEGALGRLFAAERRRTTMRMIEAERRIAELEVALKERDQ